jgi:asparagine synthase (glutamine-hydrolysing)
MCGIAGAFGPLVPPSGRVDRTLALMAKRGPDAKGVYQSYLDSQPVTLLHSRLSILDLEPRSNQPFRSEGCVLVYNGEIYNYLELKKELSDRGARFETDSDTEVIIKAYREWGPDCLERFEGMWAFALLDEREGRLWLSRDRFGEKPLYYALWDETLYFASEVKFLASLSGRNPSVNRNQICRYLVNGYRALYKQPETFFDDVTELPAASMAILRGREKLEPRQYWQLHYRPQSMTMDEALEGVRAHLFQAMKIRLRADVPIAFCLSGGVDSTALASIATKHFGSDIHAFSIVDSDERYDESQNIALTVQELACRHHITHIKTDNFFERMTDLVDYHDAPVATISYYVHAFLSEAISSAGFKVAISGTGADELFTGYYDHYGFWLAEMYKRHDHPQLLEDWREGYGAHVRNPVLQDPLAFHHNPDRRDHIFLNRDLFNSFLLDPTEEDFHESRYSDSLLRNRMLNELHNEVVPMILHEDDLNSMCWSVENRAPYLDRGLAEFLASVPTDLLIHNGYTKWLLRAAVRDLAPAPVINDKHKRGFNASIDSLVDCNDADTIDRLLSPGPIFDFVKRDRMERFLTGDFTDNSLSKFLFSFISAKLFLESNLVSGATAGRFAA